MLKKENPQVFTLIQKKIYQDDYIKKKALKDFSSKAFFELDYQDSNLDKQNQNLLCYHYTIVQTYALSVKKRCKELSCGSYYRRPQGNLPHQSESLYQV